MVLVKGTRTAAKLVKAHGLYDLDAIEGKAPSEFRVFSYGVNTSDKGDFLFDEQAAKSVMAAFSKKGSALTADYEHQAFNSATNGQPAPNSIKAWTPSIRLNAEGKPELWATDVKWTPRASAYIESGEYNHFSPAFEADPKTMRIERIVNLALTNIPALDQQEPLIAASQGVTTMKKLACKLCQKTLKAPTEDEDGDEVMCTDHAVIPKMSAIFGLRADSSMGIVLEAAGEASHFRGTVLELLGAKNPVEALGLIGTLKSQREEITALKTQIANDASAALTKEFELVLEEAGKSGKLAPDPAVREKFTKPLLAMSGGKVTKDAIDFARNHFLSMEAKVNVTDANGGGGKAPGATDGAATTLSQADLDVARLTGVAGVDIVAHRKLAATGAFKPGVEKPLKHILLA